MATKTGNPAVDAARQLAAVHQALADLNQNLPPARILDRLLGSILALTGCRNAALLTPEEGDATGGQIFRIRALRGEAAAKRLRDPVEDMAALAAEEDMEQRPLWQNQHCLGYLVWIREPGAADGAIENLEPLLAVCTQVLAQHFSGSVVRRAEEAERSLSSFKKILDNTLDMIFMFDPISLKFVYINRGAVQTMGYREAELLQLRPCDIKPEYPEARFRGLIQPLLEGREQALFFETIHRRKDGSDFPVDVLVQYIPDEGEHGLFVNIVRDLTERRHLDRMKREFVSTVSHELRTPLTSIQGALGLMQAGTAGELSERARQLVAIAHNNSGRLLRLINDILDIEKVEAGKLDFNMAPHRLADLAEQALASNRHYAQQFGVALALENDAPELWLDVDEDRFAQIIANLLSNAVKFSPQGEAVRVRISRRGDDAQISVSDRGPGISPDVQARIFQKFAQGDSSDARNRSGTGLGLSIVKALTEQMGGRIAFESEPDEGTTFILGFPLRARPPRAEG